MIESTLAFLAGLLIGSFLNVCIYRLPRDLSVVHPRSFCPGCGKQIAWYDNVPVLGFVLLGGKCRNCRTRIPARYPLVELLTGLLFAWAVYSLGATLPALKLCIFSAILVTLVATDLEARILPDEFTLGGTIIGFVLSWTVPMRATLAHLVLPRSDNVRLLSVVEAVLGAIVSAGSIFIVAKLYEWLRRREGMGLGDVKMIAMIGAFLGLQGGLLTLIIGSMIGGVGGLLFILLTRKDPSTYQLPFGAFLGVAALAVASFGERMIGWYLGLRP
jgi:leader peptidase (prepilin peptidase)/N-methyltransferase